MAERAILAAPLFQGRGGIIASPFQFIFTGEDGLRLTVYNRQAGLTVTLRARWLPKDSDRVEALQIDFRPSSDGLPSSTDIDLDRGVLLTALLAPSKGQIRRGQVYARLDVIRGRDANLVLGTLIAGYIGSYGGRAWPGSVLESPLEGPGWLHTIDGTLNGAGAAASITVPENTRYRIHAVTGSLSCSGAAANRTPYLQLVNGGTTIGYAMSNLTQIAGSAQAHTWQSGAGLSGPAAPIFGHGTLPCEAYLASELTANAQLLLNADGLQAGDNFIVYEALVEEWRHPISQLID